MTPSPSLKGGVFTTTSSSTCTSGMALGALLVQQHIQAGKKTTTSSSPPPPPPPLPISTDSTTTTTGVLPAREQSTASAETLPQGTSYFLQALQQIALAEAEERSNSFDSPPPLEGERERGGGRRRGGRCAVAAAAASSSSTSPLRSTSAPPEMRTPPNDTTSPHRRRRSEKRREYEEEVFDEREATVTTAASEGENVREKNKSSSMVQRHLFSAAGSGWAVPVGDPLDKGETEPRVLRATQAEVLRLGMSATTTNNQQTNPNDDNSSGEGETHNNLEAEEESEQDAVLENEEDNGFCPRSDDPVGAAPPSFLSSQERWSTHYYPCSGGEHITHGDDEDEEGDGDQYRGKEASAMPPPSSSQYSFLDYLKPSRDASSHLSSASQQSSSRVPVRLQDSDGSGLLHTSHFRSHNATSSGVGLNSQNEEEEDEEESRCTSPLFSQEVGRGSSGLFFPSATQQRLTEDLISNPHFQRVVENYFSTANNNTPPRSHNNADSSTSSSPTGGGGSDHKAAGAVEERLGRGDGHVSPMSARTQAAADSATMVPPSFTSSSSMLSHTATPLMHGMAQLGSATASNATTPAKPAHHFFSSSTTTTRVPITMGSGVGNTDNHTTGGGGGLSERAKTTTRRSSTGENGVAAHISAPTPSSRPPCEVRAEETDEGAPNPYGLHASVAELYFTARRIQSLYPWQDEVLRRPAMQAGRNFVYSLPTSGGKTLVAEVCLLRCVAQERRSAMLVVPFVSLAEEKTAALTPFAAALDFIVEGQFGTTGRMPPPPPRVGPATPYLFVCTIEKANALLNFLLEEGRAARELGVVVVDELHMLGEERRGATLELFLSKLLLLNSRVKRKAEEETGKEMEEGGRFTASPPNVSSASVNGCQIIGMSATIPNLHAIASWLQAEFYIGDFRPVELVQYCVVNGERWRNGEAPPSLPPAPLLPGTFTAAIDLPPGPGSPCAVGDAGTTSTAMSTAHPSSHPRLVGSEMEQLYSLASEIPDSSVLIFCASRQQCIYTAKELARIERSHRPHQPTGNAEEEKEHNSNDNDSHSIDVDAEELDLQSLSKTLVDHLRELLPSRVAYHHGGLLQEEREVIERAYWRRHIRWLCCTSTLAAGVNLPARRVLFKTPYVGREFLTSSRYRQMSGRAGRAGIDAFGESFLFLSRRDVARGRALVQSPPEMCESQLLEGGGLGTLQRALMECIETGLIRNEADMREWGETLLCRRAWGAGVELHIIHRASRHSNAPPDSPGGGAGQENDGENSGAVLLPTPQNERGGGGEGVSSLYSLLTSSTTHASLDPIVREVLEHVLMDKEEGEGVEVGEPLEHTAIEDSQKKKNNDNHQEPRLEGQDGRDGEEALNSPSRNQERRGASPSTTTARESVMTDTREEEEERRCTLTCMPARALRVLLDKAVNGLLSVGLVRSSTPSPSHHLEKVEEEGGGGENSNASVSPSSTSPPLKLSVTPFGLSAVRSCFSVEEAVLVRGEFDNLRRCGLILSDDLHLCYFLTPLREVSQECDWALYRVLLSQLSDDRQRIANLIGVDEQFVEQKACGVYSLPKLPTLLPRTGGAASTQYDAALSRVLLERRRQFVASRFFVALLLADVLAEVPMETLEATFNVTRGRVQSLMRSASMFSSSMTSFCRAMEWYALEAVLASFVKRLGFGAKPDIVPLLELKTLTAGRARAVWNAGYKDIPRLAELGLTSADGKQSIEASGPALMAAAAELVASVKRCNAAENMAVKFFTPRQARRVIQEALQWQRHRAAEEGKENIGF